MNTLEHHTTGEIKVVVYSETENKARTAPPLLGQHTNEVLSNLLQYSDDRIQSLRADKIIQ